MRQATKLKVKDRTLILTVGAVIIIGVSMVIASLLPSSGLGNFYAGSGATTPLAFQCCLYKASCSAILKGTTCPHNDTIGNPIEIVDGSCSEKPSCDIGNCAHQSDSLIGDCEKGVTRLYCVANLNGEFLEESRSCSAERWGCCIYSNNLGVREQFLGSESACISHQDGTSDPIWHFYAGRFCGPDPTQPPPCPVDKTVCSTYKGTICCGYHDLCKINDDDTPRCQPK